METNSAKPDIKRSKAEVPEKRPSRKLTDSVLFIVRGLVLSAFTVFAFNTLFALLIRLFSGRYNDLFFHHLDPHFYSEKWTPLFVIFASIIFIDTLVTVFITKKKQSPAFFAPFIPFLFFALVSDEKGLIYSALVISTALFVLRKVNEIRPLAQIPDSGWYAKDSTFIKVMIGVGFAAVMVGLDHFLVGPNRASMIFLLFFLIGITFFCTGRNYRATIKTESALLFLATLCGLVIHQVGLAFKFDILFSPLLFIFLFTFFHFSVFFYNRKTLRWVNLAIPLILILTFSSMENYLFAYHIGEKKRALEKLAIHSEPKKGIIGKALPFGDLNPRSTGWSFEIGHFRNGPPSKEKKPNTYRIIVQGSSSTEGVNIKKNEDVWSFVLERKLNRSSIPYEFEVINAGIGGTTSFGMLKNFSKELLQLKPDMLILYVGHNDQSYKRGPFTEKEMFAIATDDALAGSFPNPLTEIEKTEPQNGFTKWIVKTQMVLSQFASYRLLRREILDLASVNHALFGFALSKVWAVPPEDFRNNLEQFALLCKKHDVQFVLVGEACLCNLEQYKEIMMEVATKQNIPYFDANQKLSQCGLSDNEIFLDVVHLTEKGNVCLASVIRNHLLNSNLLPASVSK